MRIFNINKNLKGSVTAYNNILASRMPEKDKEEVRYRLKIIDFYNEFGIAATEKAFDVTGRTVRNWKKELREKGIQGLIPQSTKPKHVRGLQTDKAIVDYIQELKSGPYKIGRGKIAELVRIKFNETIAEQTVTNIITYLKRRGELPEHTKLSLHAKTGRLIVKKPKKTNLKLRRKGYMPESPGDLVQMDTIVIYVNGSKYYLLTAIDVLTRIAYAHLSVSHSSKTAEVFLRNLPANFTFEVRRVQTDNGSEFAKYFEQACLNCNIVHFWNHPRTPKENAFIERFNRSLQEEWLVTVRSLFLNGKIDEINTYLTKYLEYYNEVRPHYGIGKMTPRECLRKWKNVW